MGNIQFNMLFLYNISNSSKVKLILIISVNGYFSILLFCIWLYHPRFKGALLIGNFIHWLLKVNKIITKLFNVWGEIVDYI